MKKKLKGLPNPKDLYGVKKVPSFSVVPVTSMIYEALAMWEGAAKYGPFNWRDHPVRASVYFDALDRHVKAIIAGQWIDPLSNKPHAGHAKACLGILIDAYETGNLIWDLPESQPAILKLLAQYDQSTPPQEDSRVRASSRPANQRHSAAPARRRARSGSRAAARRR